MNAAFIGLGSMGIPMASNLLKNGVKLFVYNRSVEKADSLISQGATLLKSPREAFEKTEIVFTMVADNHALHEIVEGDQGLLASAKPGKIHVSMSTISPKTSRDLAESHRTKEVHFLAAPVFGRPDVAAPSTTSGSASQATQTPKSKPSRCCSFQEKRV